MFKSAVSLVLAAGALAFAAPQPAAAITQVAGVIETFGTNATVDFWYFTMGAAVPLQTGINLTPINGPFTTEDAGLLVYQDVGGAIGALLGSAGVAGDSDRNARVDFALLAPGNYIAVVSSATLSAGDLGPFQTDPAVSVPITYELTLDQAGGNESIFTCSIEGNLNGTFTKSPPGAACIIPGSSSNVPAPGSLALLLAGIAGAAGLGARRRF